MLSDMAASVDRVRQPTTCASRTDRDFAGFRPEVLAPGGWFVVKILQGGAVHKRRNSWRSLRQSARDQAPGEP